MDITLWFRYFDIAGMRLERIQTAEITFIRSDKGRNRMERWTNGNITNELKIFKLNDKIEQNKNTHNKCVERLQRISKCVEISA